MDSRPRRSFNPLSFLWTLIKLAVTVGVVALLVGLFWPPKVPEVVTDPARADAFEESVDRLLEAAEEQRVHAEVFTAHDINAYLSRQVAKASDPDSATGMAVGLRQVRVELQNERALITVDTSYGPARIVLMVVGRPAAGANGFEFRIEKTQVGRITVPVRYGGWIADKVRSVVQGMENEKRLLNAVRQFEVRDGQIRVMVGAARTPGT